MRGPHGVVVALVAAACGNAAARSSAATVASQQAGGDTAWVSTSFAPGAGARAIAPVGAGSVVVGLAPQPDGTAASVAILDGAGEPGWSETLASSCPVLTSPLGVTRSGLVAALISTACGAPVAGLASAPVASGTVVLVDATGGSYVRTLLTAADIAAAGIARAVTTSDGSVAVVAATSVPVVADVAEDGVERWRWSLAGAGAIAAAPSGDVVVAVATAPAQVVRIAHDGSQAWTRELPAGFALQGYAVLTDGAVAALGIQTGPVEWGRGGAGTAAGPELAILVLEPDGTPRTAAAVAGTVAGQDALLVGALPHGRVLLTGFSPCDRLRALSPQLEPVWERTVDARCGARVAATAVSGAGQVTVAGAFRGRADFGSGHVAESAAGIDAPFVLAVWP